MSQASGKEKPLSPPSQKQKREANRSIENPSQIRRKRTMSNSNSKHMRSTTHREQEDWPHTRMQLRRLRSTSRCPRNSFNSTCNTSSKLSRTSLPSNKQDRHSRHSHHNNNRVPGEDTSQRLVKARLTFSHQQTTASNHIYNSQHIYKHMHTTTTTQHIAQYISLFFFHLQSSFESTFRSNLPHLLFFLFFSFGIEMIMISLPVSHHLFPFPFPFPFPFTSFSIDLHNLKYDNIQTRSLPIILSHGC